MNSAWRRSGWSRRAGRRGFTLMETMSALALTALIMGPMLLINFQTAQNLTRTRIQLSLQKQLVATLSQTVRQLREADTITSLSATSIDFKNREGSRRRIYQDGSNVWIRLGEDGQMEPIALATDAASFSMTYAQVVSGTRAATTDVNEVDEVQVTLMLEGSNGTKLQGEQLVTLRLSER